MKAVNLYVWDVYYRRSKFGKYLTHKADDCVGIDSFDYIKSETERLVCVRVENQIWNALDNLVASEDWSKIETGSR